MNKVKYYWQIRENSSRSHLLPNKPIKKGTKKSIAKKKATTTRWKKRGKRTLYEMVLSHRKKSFSAFIENRFYGNNCFLYSILKAFQPFYLLCFSFNVLFLLFAFSLNFVDVMFSSLISNQTNP